MVATTSTMRRAAMLVVALALGVAAAAQPAGPRLATVPRANLCVTEGMLDELRGGQIGVSVPKMRAYVNRYTTGGVEADLTYLGSTGDEARLGSGELRRQFGLKLRAQDACNLVYAMWRIEPESKLVVSVKSNPGQHTSAECGNRGYKNIKPQRSTPVPMLQDGVRHTLRAEMSGDELRVFADDGLVWQGSVGPEATAFDGPVGMRSDNARLRLELRAGHPAGAHPDYVIACRTGPAESE